MSQDALLRELRTISKVLVLSNSAAIETELSKIASSKERKQMWVCIDGKRMLKDIADLVKVTSQSVGQFLLGAAAAALVEYQRGRPPRRILDYVPPQWLSLIQLPPESEPAKDSTPTPSPGVA